MARIKSFLDIYSTSYRYYKTVGQFDHSKLSARKKISRLQQRWANEILRIFDVDFEIVGTPVTDKNVIYVGNHISYLDIPVMMALTPTSFVAKQEISHWPVFGKGASKVGTVFVKRSCSTSRKKASETVAQAILGKKQSVTIFPSGTTTTDESKPWRGGAFKIASKFDIPIQPFRMRYEPLRQAAYIDRDFFPVHLMNLLKNRSIKVFIEFHDPVIIKDPIEESNYWWKWSQEVFH